MGLSDLQPSSAQIEKLFAACFEQIFCSFHPDGPNSCIGKKNTQWSNFHWNFTAPGQARPRRKDLIVKWIWLLHAFCEPWGLQEETCNGRISTHPPLPTTACTPHADIFTRVGAISNHTSTRPGCFDRETRMKQQKPLSEKKKKAFHGPTLSICCAAHTLPPQPQILSGWTERCLAVLLCQQCTCSSFGAYRLLYFW